MRAPFTLILAAATLAAIDAAAQGTAGTAMYRQHVQPLQIAGGPSGAASGPQGRSAAPCTQTTDPSLPGKRICEVEVTVSSFTHWGRRCQIKVDPEILIVPLKAGDDAYASQFVLRWRLSKTTGTEFAFDRSLGIAIADVNLAAARTYKEPAEPSAPASAVDVGYLRASAQAHDYNVHIVRNRGTAGSPDWVTCGVLDPIIVNRE